MSVTRVVPKSSTYSASMKGAGMNEYEAVAVITTDNAHDDSYTVLSAGPYSKGSYFTWFDYSDPLSICYEASPRKISDFVWEVTYKFRPRNRESSTRKGDEAQDPNPLLRTPDVEWTTEEVWRTAWKAYRYDFAQQKWSEEMEPVVNSAGGRFSQPLQYAHPRPVLRYARNEEVFPHEVAVEYTFALNSDSFLGYGPGQVQCRAIRGQWRFEDVAGLGQVSFWRVEYEFLFDREGLFYEDILNEGYAGYKNVGTPGMPVYVLTVREAEGDETGRKVPMTGPFLLAHDGTFLSKEDIEAGNVTYCRFSRPKWKAFSDLAITLPY